jgi:pimeloyl-ACP methyl ester carboxylesterase
MMIEYKGEDKYITVDNYKIRYQCAGSGQTTVVLLHGLGGYIENWYFTIPALIKDYTVYTIDMLGFGKSDKPMDKPYTYQFFARFLHQILTALGIKRMVLIGHSLGGGTSLQYSIYYPESVEKLVVIGSGGLSYRFSLALRVLTLPGIGEKFSRPSYERIRKILESIYINKNITINEEWVELAYAMSRVPDARQIFLKTLRSGANLFSAKGKVLKPIMLHLDEIQAETLLIWGRQDKTCPFQASSLALRKIPRVEILALDRCGHFPMGEHTELVNRRLVEFLATLHKRQ